MPSQEAPRRLLRNPYLWATVAGLVLIPAMRPFLRFEPAPPPLYGTLPDTRLVDQSGALIELPADDDGGPRPGAPVLVVGFFTTACGADCEPVLSGLSELAARLRSEDAEDADDADNAGDAEDAETVIVAAITVDPWRDTPEAVRRFATDHGLDSGEVRLLTGEPRAVRRLLIEGFRAGDPRVLLARAAGSAPAKGEPYGAGDVPAGDVPAGGVAAGGVAPDLVGPGLAELASAGRLTIVDRSGGLRGSYGVDAAGLDEVFHRSRHVLEERRPPRPARLPTRRTDG